MHNMNKVIRKLNSKIMKNPASSTIKICNCHCKTDSPMDGNYLSECLIYKVTIFLNVLFTKLLLRWLLMNIVMVLVKTLSKNVTITTNVFLEMYIMKRTLNSPNMYRNRERERHTHRERDRDRETERQRDRERLIILLIGKLLWNRRNMSSDHVIRTGSVTRADSVSRNTREELFSKFHYRNKVTLRCLNYK